MDAGIDRKSVRLANAGRVLGVLTLGTIAGAFISPRVITIDDKSGLAAPIAVGGMVALFGLSGLLLGLIGLVVSLVALRRNVEERGARTKNGIAITGAVLNGLGVAIVCVFLAYGLFSVSRTPPPPPTPPPPVG
jgi:hypothetical protein